MTYFNFKAVPVPADAREDSTKNERRFRASLETAMRRADVAISGLYNAIGEGANTYYMRVTDDAGDGTLAGDANATDYTGQDSTVDTCADIPNNNSVYYFIHKDQIYVYTGPRPVRFGAACPDTVIEADFTPFGGLVDWDDIVNKPAFTFLWLTDTPSGYSEGMWPRSTANGLVWDEIEEEDISDLDRVRWRGNWVQQEYLKNDQVLDYPYLMIANKTTTSRAAPIDIGAPTWDLPDSPTWDADGQFSGVVWSGVEYTFTQLTEIQGYAIWVPTLTADTEYVIRLYSYPVSDPTDISYQQVPEAILVENAWTLIEAVDRTILAGTVIGLVIDALNSGSSTTDNGGWNRAANSNATADPGSQNWRTNNAESQLTISTTDLDSLDRQGELLNIVAGSTITITELGEPSRSMTWSIGGNPTDGTTYVHWDNVVYDGAGAGGEPVIGNPTTVSWEIPVASPTDYKVDADGNAARTLPTGVTSRGLLRLGGDDQSVDAQAFGVRVQFQEKEVSADWDYQAGLGSGGGGGGGGSGGASSFTELNDTPVSYAGSENYAVTVNADGSGLEFTEAPTTPVEIVESGLPGSGWQVWGDALLQWGFLTTGGTGYDIVSFNPAFAAGTNPYVVAVTNTALGNGQLEAVSFSPINEASVAARTRRSTNGVISSPATAVRWIAIGTAPDHLKKPKTITAGGGGGSYVYKGFRASLATDWDTGSDIVVTWDNILENHTDGAFDGTVYTVPAAMAGKRMEFTGGIYKSGTGLAGCGVQRSTDGGATWPEIVQAAAGEALTVFSTGPVLLSEGDKFRFFGYTGTMLADLRNFFTGRIIDGVEGEGVTPLEFHDPTGAHSWRIVGNTLECWGRYSHGGGGATVNFPKTFKNAPRISVTPEPNASLSGQHLYVAHVAGDTLTGSSFQSRCRFAYDNGTRTQITATGVALPCHYHAIGEWDGT